MGVDRIEPDWSAPPRVRALCTTRGGGVSAGPFAGLNLADHVGDEPSLVAQNRALLRKRLVLPTEPHWLRQVHGCTVADVVRDPRDCRADAVIASCPRKVCAVLTADCLPLLLCDAAGTRVAAVHAGWRGLAEGVIEAVIARFAVPPREVLCWLGPAIGPEAFEVGAEVRACFLAPGGAPRPRSCRQRGTHGWRIFMPWHASVCALVASLGSGAAGSVPTPPPSASSPTGAMASPDVWRA